LIENVELKLNETRWMAIYVETRVSGRMGVTRDARVVRGGWGDANARGARARLADEDGANKRQRLSFIVFYSTSAARE
jgi:hypothetical protein